MITYKLSLCIGASSDDKPLVIKCHDTGFNLRVSLFVRRIGTWQDEMERYSIPAGAAAVLKITKPDGTFCESDGIVEGNKIFFATPPEAFTVAGTDEAEVAIYGADGRRVTSATFNIEVPEECVCHGTEQSKPYVDIVGQQVARAVEAADRAQGYATHPPVIGENGNWWLWDGEAYEDSGYPATGGGGGTGEAGGYYSVSFAQVDANTLRITYTPSKADMPPAPDELVTLPAGPAGPAGADGKDGKDGKDGAAGANGKDGEKGDPGDDYVITEADLQEIAALASTPDQYVLIESITTTEEVKEIKRTLEPDGRDYAFTQIFANIYVPVAPAVGHIYFRVNQADTNTNVGYIDTAISNTAVRYSRFMADVSQGLLFTSQTIPGGASSNPYMTTFVPSWGRAANVIDQLRLIASGGNFPVGAKIDIYAVRVNPTGSIEALADEIISKQEQYIGGES